ncbi:Exosome component 3 [Kappamyces sp. JEL0829]|nr:Exosome component 3 [Kappamyces sp. JEL0829]
MVVQAVKAGLVNEANSILYLDNPQKRYLPQVGEPVVGVVAGKMGDGWKIDIRGPQAAYLDSLAFEGATKRNKPSLAIGSLVYGRITIANRDMDPEMECVGLSSKSEGFGELGTDGTVATLSLPMSRSLMNPANPILQELSKALSFELVVGLNGLAWINGESTQSTAFIYSVLVSCDGQSASKTREIIKASLAAS